MILKAKDISKSYQKTSVLKNLSLSAQAGESIAICGRSGEGKTTLLHILGTLEEPDTGSLEICGQLVTRANGATLRNQRIGFIFQSYNLLDDFTALENVSMPARIARRPFSPKQGLDLLSLVGLADKAALPAKFLSGGERQRIAIARALCNNPDLLFADEPTGNLDQENAHKVIELLLSFNKTLLLVTHDPSLAALCHTRLYLTAGQLVKAEVSFA